MDIGTIGAAARVGEWPDRTKANSIAAIKAFKRFPDISHLLSECFWKAKMWGPLDTSQCIQLRRHPVFKELGCNLLR
jgi:hypothetical protein